MNIETKELLKELRNTEFEYKIIDEGVLQNIEQLNGLGRERWEIVTIYDNKVIFKRVHEETLHEKEEKEIKKDAKEKFGMIA